MFRTKTRGVWVHCVLTNAGLHWNPMKFYECPPKAALDMSFAFACAFALAFAFALSLALAFALALAGPSPWLVF